MSIYPRWDDFDLSEPDEPKTERMVWIFRPGKNVRGTAFLALVHPDKLNADGTTEYAGEVCQWKEFKP